MRKREGPASEPSPPALAIVGPVFVHATMDDYEIPQQWVGAFVAAGFRGILYVASFTKGADTVWAIAIGSKNVIMDATPVQASVGVLKMGQNYPVVSSDEELGALYSSLIRGGTNTGNVSSASSGYQLTEYTLPDGT